jgi:hypothetical protein
MRDQKIARQFVIMFLMHYVSGTVRWYLQGAHARGDL